jgi:Tat protein translocase TatB subunit
MFNIGTQELLLILVLALVVVGPQKLPELARSIGRGMREFRKMQDEVKDMVKVDLNPEPPSVHQPGVSGPRSRRQPHRTARPTTGSTSDEPTGDAPSGAADVGATDGGGEASEADAGSAADEPRSGDDGPEQPPAAAGAG